MFLTRTDFLKYSVQIIAQTVGKSANEVRGIIYWITLSEMPVITPVIILRAINIATTHNAMTLIFGASGDLNKTSTSGTASIRTIGIYNHMGYAKTHPAKAAEWNKVNGIDRIK